MKISEILSEVRGWYDIVSDIPMSDVCDVTDIANDLAYDINRMADRLEIYMNDVGDLDLEDF